MKPSTAALHRYIYIGLLFMLALTGFAQMPIFKRYYIADIPGLGWLAQFYTTHFLHYLFAVVFIGYSAYRIAEYIAEKRKMERMTAMGFVRAGLLAGLVLTGALLVIRNLSGMYFPPDAVVVFDLSHLGLVMAFLMVSAAGAVLRTRWTRFESAENMNRGQTSNVPN